ncbi:MAG: DUF1571 domain-containing protein [Bacteroidetes bacterium]|nr:DUF1571 domain-containing protein [Bacteroidota bacterium]
MAGRIGFFLQVLPVFAALTTAGQAPSPRELTENMMAAVRQIKTASFTVKKWERINGIIKYSSSDAVMSKNPLQIYMNIKAGHRKGYRFLWIEGDHGGDALVKYPDFPAVNIPVNPRGSLFRYNEHHTIFELGFDYFLKITEGSIHTTGDA